MYNRFRCREHGTSCARFLAIKQEQSVNEYLQRFEELSTPLPEMAEDVLVGTFTNGLDPIIRTEEKLEAARNPQGPYAKEIKTDQKQGGKTFENPTTKIVTLVERVPTHSSTSISSQVTATGSGVRRENNFRRWTDSELQARREKGLCYQCDEPFSKGHRCKNKELRLYLVADDLEDTEMEDVENENGPIEVSPVVELSLNSVVGLTALGTFKVKGTVEDREIIIMIDYGATHNFISLKLVDEQSLPTTETTSYNVIMGSGKAVQGQGM